MEWTQHRVWHKALFALKKLRLSKLREKAFKYLSIYKRQLGMDGNGYNKCITCGVKSHWKQLQGSHFIHGHSKSTYLEPTNVHPACVRCNLYLSGNLVSYGLFMNRAYGIEEVQRLWNLSHKVVKFDRSYYEGIILLYKGKVKE